MPDAPDRPPRGSDDTGSRSERLDHPERIGHYRILQVLGEGGMGIVYEAEQTEPIHRRVALKSIKLGMDTKQVLARFEAERQALAVMDHSGIAKVLDAGATDTGRSYFVMELVKGIPLTEYCDLHRLSTAERLRVFIGVCHAIQHAHQKGVIHRDLKPSNILVTVQQEQAVPKVIDFGIAKAVGYRLTERTLATQMGEIVGTPQYMSPEQAERSGLDVDTRTDVFTLGVILYELMTGSLPFDVTSSAAAEAIPWILREEDPPTPSARFGSLGDEQAAVADRRATDPETLRKQLRGDLDWIVLKAMAKDRTRRYETASGFALDVQRYLGDEPVLARPPSKRYRIAKFVKRNKAGVVAAATVVVALMTGIALATGGLVRATRAQAQTREEAETAQRISDFMVSLFNVADPSEARGNSITAREILDEGAADIQTELDDQPVMRGRLMHVMGRVYRNLGLFPVADSLLTSALETQRSVLGADHVDVAETMGDLAYLHGTMGRLGDAVALAEQALTIFETRLGPQDPRTAAAHSRLGVAYRSQGDYSRARTHLERGLAIREDALGAEHIDVAWSLFHLGWLHRSIGEYEEAKALLQRAMPIAERELGVDHPRFGDFLNDFAVVLSDLGDTASAREHYQRVLDLRERTLGPEHLMVARVLQNLGNLAWRADNVPEARRYYERSLDIREKSLGSDNPDFADALNGVALVYQRNGAYAEAAEMYAEAIRIIEAARAPNHLSITYPLTNLGWLRRHIGDFAAAQSYLERALAIREREQGDDHARLLPSLVHLGYLFRDRGEHARAHAIIARRLAIAEMAYGPEHFQVGWALEDLGNILVLLDEYDSAGPVLERARSLRPDANGPVLELATLHHRRGDIPTADSLFARWYEMLEQQYGRSSAWFAFHTAVHWAIVGNRDETIARLKLALERGHSDPWLTRHHSLAWLRGDPEFDAIVAEVRRRSGIDTMLLTAGR